MTAMEHTAGESPERTNSPARARKLTSTTTAGAAPSDLFIFDIDRTLVHSTGGAAAMNLALGELIGAHTAFLGVDFSGRTDRAIIRDALRNCAHEPPDFEAFVQAFEARYIPAMEQAISGESLRALPGARELVAAVRALPNARAGVATGNFRRAALAKLRACGFDSYLSEGGFADDAEARPELVRVAIERLGGAADGGRVFVIGDTPHDIRAALANGAVAVGVATSRPTAAMLHEAGAHHVFADLSRPEDVLRRLLSEPASIESGG